MQIAITNIYPNPFKRQIVNGELNEEKVLRLMESVEKTGFWDNVLVRPHPDKNDQFQLCYGHHRLEAVKRLFGDEHKLSLPVHDIDEETMLRIMANENVETEEDRTIYQIDMVTTVKAYLEANPEVAQECYVKYMEAHPEEAKHQKYNPEKTSGSDVFWKPRPNWTPGNKYAISGFLGEKNWSATKIFDLLKLKDRLAPDIVEKLTWKREAGADKGFGLTKTVGVILSGLKGGTGNPDQERLGQLADSYDVSTRVIRETVGIINDDSYSDHSTEKTVEWLEAEYPRTEICEDDTGEVVQIKKQGRNDILGEVHRVANRHKANEAVVKHNEAKPGENIKEYEDLILEVSQKLRKRVKAAFNYLITIDADKKVRQDVEVWPIVASFVSLAEKFKKEQGYE